MLLFGMFLIPNAHTNITEIDIDFQVGKCNVDTAYSDNARQLANLEKTIQYVNSHPNVRIERLTISGYASPEGPAVKNKQLGETRATRWSNTSVRALTLPTRWWCACRRRFHGIC